MDNRIANDMISSGMIPSGKKNKEDLSRTQYGSVPSPSKLMDAYKSMYEHHKKDADGNTIPHEGEELNEGKIPAGLQAYLDKKKGKKEDKKEVKEENVDEAAPLAALAPLLTKVAAIGKGAAATAGKALVKGAVKVGGKTGGAMMKSVVRNPMQTMAKVDMVGRMIPKPSGLPGAQKKKQGDTVSAGSYQAADVDLFDIVKGQLLDEGLSEEEIRDIMLTLTPDEILNEMGGYPMGKGGNYRETPKPNKPEPKPGEDGSKFDAKGRPRFNPLNKDPYSGKTSKYDEEYKNFDPKKPDPKQVAAQAKQEKNRQKFNDPMGVKNTNIGGQGLDPMDK